ncbi:MAG: response regulator [bacterium]
MPTEVTKFTVSEQAHVLIVDSSKLVRTMIQRVMQKDLPEAVVTTCENGEQAKQELTNNVYDLVTTSLRLADMDGVELAQYIREHSPQRFIPIIVVSGDTRDRLEDRTISAVVTDYFDKSEGYTALASFIHGYVRPNQSIQGNVLYIEDSRVVALATRRMLEGHGIHVEHRDSIEGGLEYLQDYLEGGECPVDIILSDVYLKGGLTGHDLLKELREQRHINRADLPILVMTGDDDNENQSSLLKSGANDLVEKPIEEHILINKIRFQLQLSHRFRSH